jgi:hypothetical protein
MIPNDLPSLESLSEIKIIYNGCHNGYDVNIEGLDIHGDVTIWNGRSLYIQGVEDVIKILREKACGPI